ncbi:hypothetical protein BCV70DRAFT_40302 [Testicularia cyperi]|uniref:Uncharacterized protein n=1 Tax=Testicularia cyperi TaxID=1882483 RepID=A0A317XIN1_9BASI|nr:hypothetical protein BCV70DRAFT_40302 [Testicularia cyperi]
MTPPIPYAYSTIVGQLKPGSEASTGTSFDQDCKRTADEHNLLLFAFSLDEHDLSDTTLPRFRCFHPSICDPGPFADNGHILLGSVLEALALDVTHNDPTSDELKAMPRFPPPPHVSASRTCPQPTVRSPTAVGEAVEQLDEANGVLSLLTQDPMLFMPHNNPASTACSELRPPNSDLEWSEYLQSDMWSALDPQLPDAAHLQVEAAPNPFC